jgi:Cu/Ag efflux protein CusF
MMTRSTIALALCLAAGSASAAQKEFSASRSETMTAKVKSVDQKTREVTLVGEDGSELEFKAGEEVRNLKQVAKGDVVTARLDERLTVWLLGPDQPAPELAVDSDAYRAQPGQKPGGSVRTDLSGIATVEAIAPDKSFVTLKGPRGNLLKLDVQNKENLDGVAVGQRVGIAYAQLLAVDVVPTAKKPAKK